MVRPVAVAKLTRMPEFPDVPTLKEIGHTVTYFFYRGIAAAQGIPAEAAAFYENMFKRMAESSAWKENYIKKYMLSPSWMGSKEFAKVVAQNEEESKEILKDLAAVFFEDSLVNLYSVVELSIVYYIYNGTTGACLRIVCSVI